MKSAFLVMAGVFMMALYGSHLIRKQYLDEIARLDSENSVLWDQIRRFNDAWVEERARQAVKN